MNRSFLTAAGDVQSVPRDFIGRGEEIAKIRNFVTNATAPVVTVVLCGLPGLLACRFSLSIYTDMTQWWAKARWPSASLWSSAAHIQTDDSLSVSKAHPLTICLSLKRW